MLLKFAFSLLYVSIQVSCEKTPSIVYVIDETWSSAVSDFSYVKAYAKNMLNMLMLEIPLDDILLLTFNDTNTTRTMTQSIRVFKQAIDLIVIDNDNCSNIVKGMALSAILEGMVESQHGSYIYVFTDGLPKDGGRFEDVRTLCLKKKSKIFFIHIGICDQKFPESVEVYNKIAAECGGEVIRINIKQLDNTFKYIRESAKVAKHLVNSTLLQPLHWVEIKFKKHESTDYMFVSASGTDIQLRVVNEEGNSIGNYNIWVDNLKALKLEHLKGEVTVKAMSSSRGHVAVYRHIPAPPVKMETIQDRRQRFYGYT